jgi:hypothetical protein
LELIQDPEIRRLLVDAAETGAPPVTAISGELLERIPTKDAKLMPLKQFAGLCVRAVLEEEGFEVAETGVRVSNDPIFRTGSTYQRVKAEKSASSSLLVRLIGILTDDEAKEAIRLLRKRQR